MRQVKQDREVQEYILPEDVREGVVEVVKKTVFEVKNIVEEQDWECLLLGDDWEAVITALSSIFRGTVEFTWDSQEMSAMAVDALIQFIEGCLIKKVTTIDLRGHFPRPSEDVTVIVEPSEDFQGAKMGFHSPLLELVDCFIEMTINQDLQRKSVEIADEPDRFVEVVFWNPTTRVLRVRLKVPVSELPKGRVIDVAKF